MAGKFSIFKDEDLDLEAGDEDFNRLSDQRDSEALVSTNLGSIEGHTEQLRGVQHPSTQNSSQQITDQDNAFISRKLKENILSLEQPLRKLLIYTAFFFVMKLSRVILVLGLLIKLFFEMSCEKQSIQTLLIAAFMRDVFSSLLDMQLMFKVYEMRYKIRVQRFDTEMKEVARELIALRKVSQDGKSESSSVGFLQVEDVIQKRMDYIGYFMRILQYSYYFLFLISAVFLLKYDDEQYCHVFEKYAIIYLFLPIYFTFLLVALSISCFGVTLTVLISIALTIIAKILYKKYKNSQQILLNQSWANSLFSTPFEGLKEQLEGKSCTVCESMYSEGDEITVLKCTHHFHYSCVKKWIALRGTCPQCGG